MRKKENKSLICKFERKWGELHVGHNIEVLVIKEKENGVAVSSDRKAGDDS